MHQGRKIETREPACQTLICSQPVGLITPFVETRKSLSQRKEASKTTPPPQLCWCKPRKVKPLGRSGVLELCFLFPAYHGWNGQMSLIKGLKNVANTSQETHNRLRARDGLRCVLHYSELSSSRSTGFQPCYRTRSNLFLKTFGLNPCIADG